MTSLVLTLLSSLFAHAVQEEPITVLFMGDSITAGYGLTSEEAFPAILQARVDSLGWNVRMINAGLSGETSSGGLRRIGWLLKQRIDVLVLELGANDGLRGLTLELTEQNLRRIIETTKAAYPEARIIIAGMEVPPNLGEAYASTFRDMFPTIARDTQSDLIPFLLEGVGGEPNLNLVDRKHPNADGHRLVADTIWHTLRPIIEPSDAPPTK